mmetsp:Transcript_158395/g.280857  ORF Transcript_158395/g.280857 Transcript_158395/m.280857 type:complete len:680 (-) Transcript_158395:286-2325(-)
MSSKHLLNSLRQLSAEHVNNSEDIDGLGGFFDSSDSDLDEDGEEQRLGSKGKSMLKALHITKRLPSRSATYSSSKFDKYLNNGAAATAVMEASANSGGIQAEPSNDEAESKSDASGRTHSAVCSSSPSRRGSKSKSAPEEVTSGQGLSELRDWIKSENLTKVGATGLVVPDEDEAVFDDVAAFRKFCEEIQGTAQMKFSLRKLNDAIGKLDGFIKESVAEAFQKACHECLQGSWSRIRGYRERGRQCALADEHYRKMFAEADEQRRHYVTMQSKYLKEVSGLRDQLNHARPEAMENKGINVHLWQPLQDLDSATRDLVICCAEEQIKSALTSDAAYREALECKEAEFASKLEASRKENHEQADVITKLKEQLDLASKAACQNAKSSEPEVRTEGLMDHDSKEVLCGACGAIVMIPEDLFKLQKQDSKENRAPNLEQDSTASPNRDESTSPVPKCKKAPAPPRAGRSRTQIRAEHRLPSRNSQSSAASLDAGEEHAKEPDGASKDEGVESKSNTHVEHPEGFAVGCRKSSNLSMASTAAFQFDAPAPQNGTGKGILSLTGQGVNGAGHPRKASNQLPSMPASVLPQVADIPPHKSSSICSAKSSLSICPTSSTVGCSGTGWRKSSKQDPGDALETGFLCRQNSLDSGKSAYEVDMKPRKSTPKAAPKATPGSKIWHWIKK